MSKIKDFLKKIGENIIESADAVNPEYKIAEAKQKEVKKTAKNNETKNKYIPGKLLEDLTGDDEETLSY